MYLGRTLRFLLAVAVLACALPSRGAPAASATFTGRIIDAASGAALAGAKVALVEAPGHAGRSCADGTVRLADIAPGTYTVRVFKGGYQPLDLAGVVVAAGPAAGAVMEIPLAQAGGSGVIQLKQVTVEQLVVPAINLAVPLKASVAAK